MMLNDQQRLNKLFGFLKVMFPLDEEISAFGKFQFQQDDKMAE